MKPTKYYLIKISVPRDYNQDISKIKEDAVNIYGCDYIEEFTLNDEEVELILGRDALVSDVVPEEILQRIEDRQKQSEVEEFNIIFSSDEARQRSADCVRYLTDNYKEIQAQRMEKKWEDGIEEWKKFFSSIHVSKNINIYPIWQLNEANRYDKDKIFINPGQGFGTGGHETTWMCLKLMDELTKIQSSFEGECLDLGCGSGILGIAAIKNTDLLVTFSDVDVEAMDNCLENLTFNFKDQDLEGHCLVIRERLNQDKTYNLIFANILEQVLITEKKFILSSLNRGGYLILSGLLNDQLDNIKSHYSSLEIIREIDKNGWSAVLLRKN